MAESKLRIATFNCRSIKSSIGSVKSLCDSNDIIMLQEHWLLPDELSYLSAVDTNFVAFGSSAVDITTNVLAGRPYGGTAILCNQNLAPSIKLVDNTNSRITAVELTVIINAVTTTLLLASIYMPVDPGCQQDEDFEFVCGCLDALITDSNACGYILAGDFNFRPNSERHNFILNSLSSHGAITADISIMDVSSYA